MPKVTIHEGTDTPSQSLIKAANQAANVFDSRGRTIGIKRLQLLDRMKMFEVIGPENSKNETYMGYAALAFSVISIDDAPVPRPSNRIQFDALLQNLGDEGIEAVAGHFAAEASLGQDAGGHGDTLKNGSGTPS